MDPPPPLITILLLVNLILRSSDPSPPRSPYSIVVIISRDVTSRDARKKNSVLIFFGNNICDISSVMIFGKWEIRATWDLIHPQPVCPKPALNYPHLKLSNFGIGSHSHYRVRLLSMLLAWVGIILSPTDLNWIKFAPSKFARLFIEESHFYFSKRSTTSNRQQSKSTRLFFWS